MQSALQPAHQWHPFASTYSWITRPVSLVWTAKEAVQVMSGQISTTTFIVTSHSWRKVYTAWTVEGAASTCQKFLQILFLYLFRFYKRKLTCLGQVGPPGYDQPCKWEIVVPCRTCPARNPCSCFTSCCRPLQIITNQCHSLNPVLLFQFFWKSPLFI